MISAIKRVFSKKYTLIFLPDITGHIRRFSISKALVFSVAIVGVVSLAVFGYFARDILRKNQDLRELASLRSVAAGQKLEIQEFRGKLKQVEAQLVRLERFDKKLRVITALEKQPDTTRDFGAGGPDRDAVSSFSTASKKYTQSLMDSLNSDLGRIKDQAEAREVSFFELDEFFKEQSSLLSHTPSIWPVRGWVTSTFGYRRSPFTGLREMHEGLDIATQLKSSIITPANGIVTRVGYHNGYGKLVEIDHGYGVMTRYGHCSRILVKVGQKVKRGQTVALVGSTGRSTGPHLHYEVSLNGVPVNPGRYILEN